MSERELFLSALEIDDPAARQAHLQTACGNDADLLGRVQALLESHESQSQFLNTPVVEQISENPELAATMQLASGSTKDADFDALSPNSAGGDAMMKKNALDDEIPLGYLQPSDKPDSLGRLAHYEVLEVVGRGAFGTVLRAFDEKLQRVVAIKVLAPEMAATSPARKRFLREARTSAAVRHENVVAIYAVEDEPIPYLVMEFIPGKTLQQRLDEQGPLDVENVLRLGKQIADGLTAAHTQGLIHRDIKPGNILLEGGMDERVKITDFGLARTADDASMTQSGMIAGTPMYMAPEQAHGHKLDQRADLFSFGSVLYQMISGRPPFRAPTTMAVLKRVTEDTPRPIQESIPEAPSWMCELIGHLHAKNPDERYQSAKEVSDLLAQCLEDLKAGRVPKIPSPSMAETVLRPALTSSPQGLQRSAKKPLALVAAVVLLMLVGLVFTELTGLTNLLSQAKQESTSETVDVNEPVAPDNLDGGVTTNLVNVPHPQSMHWPAGAPPMAMAPFNAAQAKAHQEAWAKYLGVPVEKVILLGRNNRGLDVQLRMVLVPPGEFLMGSSYEEIEKLREQARASGIDRRQLYWIDLEGPQRRVRITRPFYISSNEITTEQFGTFVQATEYKTEPEASGKGAWKATIGPPELDPALNWRRAGKFAQGPDSPVVNITWKDANECCQWLSRQHTGLLFALPTEAQWEYACRGGTTTRWFTGDEESSLDGYAVINTNWPKNVGDRLPNAFGLCDMHGNVWEWCQEAFYNYRDADDVDPVGAVEGERRIIRGGSNFGGVQFSNHWMEKSGSRSAVRNERLPDNPLLQIGFRVTAAISDDVILAATETSDETERPLASDGDERAKEQAEQVRRELKRLNPRFDETTLEPKIEGGVVVELKFSSDYVSDISPVRALTGLRSLSCNGSYSGWPTWKSNGFSRLADLSPVQGLPLERLECGATEVSDLSPLKGMPLEHFVCGFTALEDLSALDPAQLKSLWVPYTRITDASLAHFDGCRNITSLMLFGNKIGNVGIGSFSECRGLVELFLNGTEITNKGLVLFHHLEELEALGLSYTKITNEGLQVFADCRKLSHLALGHSKVTELGLAVFRGRTWTTLDLHGTQITDEGLKLYFQDCGSLRSLNLGETQITDAGLAHFAGCEELEELFLWGNSQIGDAGLAHFKGCRNLKVVQLQGTRVSDAGMVHLRNCRQLESISLNGMRVGDAGLASLRDCTELAYVNLSSNQAITDAGLAHLARCRNLRELHLSWTSIGDGGLAHLSGCPNLKILHLRRSPGYSNPARVTNAGLKQLVEDCPNLRALHLFGTDVTDFSPLKGLPHLESLSLGFQPDRDTELLRSIPSLQRINVSDDWRAVQTIEDFWKEVDQLGRFESGEWIDVLALVDPQVDRWDVTSDKGQKLTGRNEWRLENGELRVGYADNLGSKLIIPLDADWSAYEFEIEVTRRTGNAGLAVNIPTSRRDCPISFDAIGMAGIVVGKSPNAEVLAQHRNFKNGTMTRLRFVVKRGEPDHITVFNGDDDEAIEAAEWDGDCESLALNGNEGYDQPRRSSIYIASGSEFVFYKLRVRMLDGGTASTIRPVASALTNPEVERIQSIRAEQQV